MKTTELLPLIEYVPDPMRSFLNQPLTLGMFVPCDIFNELMEEPDLNQLEEDGVGNAYEGLMQDYKEAKDRVIFEGFEVDDTVKNSIGVSDKNICVDLFNDGEIYVDGERVVNTISDLCGYGLKIKMK